MGMSALEDRLAAALRVALPYLDNSAGEWSDYRSFDSVRELARALLAEYDASREACGCEHVHGEGAYSVELGNHPHKRAHCQSAEPAL